MAYMKITIESPGRRPVTYYAEDRDIDPDIVRNSPYYQRLFEDELSRLQEQHRRKVWEEEVRKAARERERRERAEQKEREYRERQEQPRYRGGNTFWDGFDDHYFDNLGEAFRGFRDSYNQFPHPGFTRTEPKTSAPPRTQTRREQLAKLAGVEWPTDITDQKLLRMAQRKCHPDTGGSHEQWIELDKLKRLMGL